MSDQELEGIAIVGMAGRFPGSRNLSEYWDNLKRGVESITVFSRDESAAAGAPPDLLAHPAYVPAGGVLDGIDLFDATFFGFSPREAELTDPQYRLFLEVAWEALENAGYDPEGYDGTVGVFAGMSMSKYLVYNLLPNQQAMEAAGPLQTRILNDKDFLTALTAYKLNLTGPSITVQTACSTSLVATCLACQSLMSYQCDLVLAGGVSLALPHRAGYLAQDGVMAPDGHCRAFDARAAGTVPGSGVGIVVLKRLADAVAGGDTIHAVIKGFATNNDGSFKVGYTAPSVDGQMEAIALAQAVAGVPAETITLIEAHGTGTPLGDPIEVAALREVFSGASERKGFCALGSVKTNIGHLDAAAGVASLIKASLAVRDGLLPPSLHFEQPNPQMDLESSPFHVNTRLTPWRPGPFPRRAGVSSFSIGGVNAHVVLEEPPAVPAAAPHSRPWQVLTLSARSGPALDALTDAFARHLAERPELSLADAAYTSHVGRRPFEHRRVVIGRDTAAVAETLAARNRFVLDGTADARERQAAFLFPGLGNHYPGMAADLYRHEPVFRVEVDRCCDLLTPTLGTDLRELLFPAEGRAADAGSGKLDLRRLVRGASGDAGPRLLRTAWSQPAVFVIEYALARLWMGWGVQPQAFLGFSIGEYVAACLAGVFSLEDALLLVAHRAELIERLPDGAMLAVPLGEAEASRLLTGGLALAAVAAPEVSVLAGSSEEIAKLEERLAADGLVCRRLETSHAFHSPLLQPAAAGLEALLRRLELRPPELPFLSNVTGSWIQPHEATDPAYWSRHLLGTVRFRDGVAELLRENRVLLEVGPGQTLSAWALQCGRGEPVVALASLRHSHDPRSDQEVLLNALGQLWIAGVAPDWRAFHAGEERRRIPLPTYPFERRRYWIEAPDAPQAALPKAEPAALPARRPNPADWLYVPSWRQSPVPSLPTAGATESQPWLLVYDRHGVGAALERHLSAAKVPAIPVALGAAFRELPGNGFEIDPADPGSWARLLETLAARGELPSTVVHLAGVDRDGAPAGAEQARVLAFDSLLYLAQAVGLLDRPEPLRIAMVTTHLQAVTGEERIVPEKATLLGACATLPLEYPTLRCRSIDLPAVAGPGSAAALADQLWAELGSERHEPVVAYRSGRRWVRHFEPLPLPGADAAASRLREGGVYLITGGMGGIGLVLAERLARRARARLVLVGRSELPPREEWDRLAALPAVPGEVGFKVARLRDIEAAGGELLLLQADVADPAQARRIVTAARGRWGRIDGVVHAAGVFPGGLAQLKTRQMVDAVFAPKLAGTLALSAALTDDPPDFFLLCSSLTGIAGSFGLVDHAAANAFLDAYAQAGGLSPRTLTLAVSWDSWLEVGQAAQGARSFLGPSASVPEPGTARPAGHPFLDSQGTAPDGRTVFQSRLSTATHWVMNEHRLLGDGLLPGTAYLEMIRAAVERQAGPGPVEVEDLVFAQPLLAPDGEMREVRVVLAAEGGEVRILSRTSSGGTWQEHARCRARLLPEAVAGRHDLAEIQSRCQVREVSGEEISGEKTRPAGPLRFGPRWQGLFERVHLGVGEGLAFLRLAPELTGDLEGLTLHPALLDSATAFAVALVEDTERTFLPLAYERAVVLAPLPAAVASHMRLRGEPGAETLSCDVIVMDHDGVERVRVEGFTMKRLRETAPAAPAAAAGTPFEVYGEGILPSEGADLFERLLSTKVTSPQVVISVRDLDRLLELAASFDRERLLEHAGRRTGGQGLHPRPDLRVAFAEPRSEIEARLTEIWKQILGLDRVGVQDNFFDLGGDSLMATRLVSILRRELGAELSLRVLFECPTVAELAAQVEEARRGGTGRSVPPLIPMLRERPLPLSFAQQRLWFVDQLEPGSPLYNVAAALRVEGPLDAAVLALCFGEIVRRHEALRTVFAMPEGSPVQVIRPAQPFSLPVVDLKELPKGARETLGLTLLREESARPFDLTCDLLLRGLLLRLTEEDHTVALTMHHIASDGWSLGILVREVAALYPAFAAGEASPLPELPVQYADFAVWQRTWLRDEVLNQEISFWRRQLAGLPPLLELPTDRPRPAVPSSRGATRPVLLPAGLTRQLEALARREGATLFMVLLAGFQTLLAHYSGQEDFAVGSPASGRNRAETEELIGFFINTLVLRGKLAGEPTFRELLGQVRDTALAAWQHQDVPFEKLVEELAPQRSLAYAPLFQVMFALQNAPIGDLEIEGLRLRPVNVGGTTARFDLTVSLEEHEGGLRGAADFAADLFDGATIERLVAHLGALLEALAADAERRLSELPLLSPTERVQLLASWTGPRLDPLWAGPVQDLLARAAERDPEVPALLFAGETVSYGALRCRVSALAAYLAALGVGPETGVVLAVDPSPEMISGLFGILEAGAAYVPLDPATPPERLAHILAETGAPVVLTQERHRSAFAPCGARVVCLDAPLPEHGTAAQPRGGTTVPESAAYVIYTSGSTGEPKGVVASHGGLASFTRAMAAALRLEPGDRVLQFASLSFDASAVQIFPPLASGATLVLHPDPRSLAPSEILDLCVQTGVTVLDLPAALWRQWVTTLPVEALGRTAIRSYLTGGEAVPTAVLREWAARAAPGASFLSSYGPTEATVTTTAFQALREGVEELAGAEAPLGRPLPNTRLVLLDRFGQTPPQGAPGEIYIGGAGVTRGYLREPGLTAERFVPDPLAGEPGARLYRTGDLARLRPTGELEFLGRSDHQVKIRGYRIEPGEIEAALTALPGVREAVVAIREWIFDGGLGDRRLVAYVVGDASVDALRQALRERLPDYMVPAAFVTLEALPLTPSGKVDRKALPAPDRTHTATGAYTAPRNTLEHTIAEIWQEVLGLHQVGREDNFFDAGGHSLLMIQVLARLRERLGRDLTVVELFQYPTVQALAEHLGAGEPALPAVVAAPVGQLEQPASGFAIIGMAGRFPGAANVDELWANLRDGREAVVPFTDDEMRAAGVSQEMLADPRYVKSGTVLEGIELFDAEFFGFSPRETEMMDPQHRLFLEASWQALEDAGYDPRSVPGRVGVWGGADMSTYVFHLLARPDLLQQAGLWAVGNGIDKDFVVSRVSYELDLKGPSVAVQTACSTSLVAVHHACRSLASGECDTALAGGVRISASQRVGYLYEEGGVNSPDGHCRAFDARARGTIGGSGVGVVVLKRLEDALRDGDTIRAVIRGTAINNDGSLKVGFTAPSVEGQAEVIATAQAAAGVSPETISYIEAHGTGTPLGDPIEVAALKRAFRVSGRETQETGFCGLGSIKTNIGHLGAAAGVAGLIKTVLALEHRQIPPSLHFEAPNPAIDFTASPFRVVDRLIDWPANGAPRRAGVSSFGIGGTNAHAVLEEAPGAPPSESTRPWHLFVLSARTPAALERKRAELADHLSRHPALHPADAAYTLQVGRRTFPHRSIVVARAAEEAAAALRGEAPGRLFVRTAPETAPEVVFLFPGQGSQRPGMGAGLYQAEPAFRREIDRGCELLLPDLGFDLRELLLAPAAAEGAARRLAATEVTQPALFVIEHALARLWMEWGVRPQALIGHSIGEYVAACLAGVFSLEDALGLVAARGRLVASLPPGAMLAVSLAEPDAVRRAEEHGLVLAAVNAPESSVLSGAADAVEELAGRLVAEGIEHRRLQTSHAFHSAALEPIMNCFRNEVAQRELRPPHLPWISNLSGTWIRPEEATDPGYWTRHLRETVRFAAGVDELLRVPGRVYLEIGPGRSLSSLVRQRLGHNEVEPVFTSLAQIREPEDDVRQVYDALGRLWLEGVEVDWPALHAHERRRRVPLPAYPFERRRFWVDGGTALPLPAETKRRAIGEWLYLPSWRRTGSPARPSGPAEGPWLLFAEASSFSHALAERLERSGRSTVIVEAGDRFTRLGDGRFTIDPRQAADYETLLSALGDEGREPAVLVHGWSLAPERPGDEGFAEAQERGLYSLLRLVQTLAARPPRDVRLCVLSNGLHEVTGAEELRPAQASLLAVARVVPQESPWIGCRVVDLERVPAASPREIDRLFSELSGPQEDPVVAYRGGHRWVQTWEPVRTERSHGEPIELRERGVYLITGGLGRIGLTLAELLAESVQARLVLLGSTPLPDRDDWPQWVDAPETTEDGTGAKIRRLLALEAMGAEILPLTADVADRRALETAVRQTEERFGHLDGVIHAAARVPVQTLDETGPDDCAAAFHAKVHGARALAEVLRDRELDFVLAFSSLASILGGLGFTAYAAANLCLDAFVVRHRREVATPWISVCWDGWLFPGGVNPPGATRANTAMTPDEGKEIFRQILSLGPPPHLAVSTTDLETRLDRWVRSAGRPSAMAAPPAEAPLHTRPDLRTPYAPPRSATESILASLWQSLLGVDRVGVQDNFFELGGHSLMATRLLPRLREAFAATISLQDLFEAPVLADLAARIEAMRQDGAERALPPLVPVPRERPLPLSFAQQRLWFLDQLEPGSPLYNLPVALRIEGPLDPRVLALTLGAIVRRHEVLRTVFAAPEGSPVQVIQPPAPFALSVVDLAGLPAREREAAALDLADAEAARPFDLLQGPLLRGLLLRLAEGDYVAALTMHHIVSDGWSMGILVREVTALYEAFAAGRPSPLPELPVQYADFAVWQSSWLHGEVLEQEIAFWRRELAGLPPLLEMPTDRPRPAVQSYRGATRPVRLPARLTRQAEALALREGATLFMVLLAAFQSLLARYSGQDDLAVGSPIAGRNRAEIEGLIGFFVNTLVLRGHLAGGPSFRELLGRVRQTTLAAYMHQDVPFEKLVEELAPERSLAHTPLFQVLFVLQNAPFGSLEIRDLRLRPVAGAGTTAKLDLTVSLAEHDGGLLGTVEHATDLYDRTTGDRLMGHFERLLAAALSAPDEPAFALPLLSPEERGQILVEWNDTAAESAPRAWVYDLFEARVRRTPDAVAVVFANEELTYAGLDARAGRLARRLRRLGVGPDVPVGLLAERSLDMIAGVLGILRAGGAYVPLDPAYPAQRLGFLLDDTRTPVLLTQAHLRGRLPAGRSQVLLLDGDDVNPAAPGAPATGGEPAADSLAYVIYTSGSTGRPKGVALSHGALRNLIDWHLATLLGCARTLQFASLSFDASFHEMFACWGSGGTLVVVPEELRRDMPALADLLVEQRIEKAILPVVVLQQLAEIFAGREDLPPLREITTTGERLQTNRATAALLRRLPGCALHNHYGPAETHVATAFTLHSNPQDWPLYPPIGRPIGNSSTYVLTPGLAPAPLGVPGDLYIGGACLARGYLGRPELTAQRFVPHPFGSEPGARLYRTGDKVRLLAHRDLEYLGRFDDQVKIRGFRIEPGEIEALLLALPGVREAAVVVREDPSERGPGERRLVAYVVGDAAVGELRGSLRAQLPDHMVPAAFVALPALPLTANGKVDRKALPAPERQGSAEAYLAPRTPVEEVLAGIWAEVLGLERVGAADHFFDLGGHSLLATQVMSRLRAAFGIELPLRDLFAAPSLAGLAARVEAALGSRARQITPPLVPMPREGPLPLSSAQQRLWFIDQLEPGSPLYNIPVALRVEGPLNAGILALCLAEIVRRHEVLRTVFAAVEGAAVQVVRPAEVFPLPVVDLTGLPQRERESTALGLAGAEAVRPFGLSHGPLLRGLLVRLAEHDHAVSLTMHHIISDGWSMGILVREVAALYAAFAAGRPSPLPALPVQYADFALWQRSWLHGEVLENEVAWWRHQLAGLPPLLELPTDRLRPAVQSFRGAARPVRLPAGLTRRLEALARREGATLFMVLLAGFQMLLARYSGQDDLAVGSPVAGRNRVEIEGLIGFFVNTLVLRGQLAGEPTFRELLGRVRETALAAYMHQDVPFEKLVEELAQERSLAHTPLFQVMLVLQNTPAESLEIQELRLRPVPVEATTAKHDLTLSLSEHRGELLGMVEYATDLYDGTTVDRLVGHFERLLASVLTDPARRASELSLLGAAESQQILVEWNDTARDIPDGALVHTLVSSSAQRAPGGLAVAWDGGEMTYGELEKRSNRLARRLRRLGVGPEMPVGLCVDRSGDLIVGILGILKAGGAYVPLDPEYPRERLTYMLADCGAPVLVAQARTAGLAAATGARPVLLDTPEPGNGLEDDGPLAPEALPEHPAYVIYTSGSKGRPKGVLVTHRGLVSSTSARLSFYPPVEACSLALSYAFDGSLAGLFWTLWTGGTLVLHRDQFLLDLPHVLATLEQRRVSHLISVPSVYGLILEQAVSGQLDSLKTVIVGGEPCPAALVAEHARRLPTVSLVNEYGPTEGTVWSSACDLTERHLAQAIPIGRPIGNVRLYVLDRDLTPVPAGLGGEIWIGGEALARGYLGRPDLTAEAFRPDPFGAAGGRLYRTGDLACWLPAGDLKFLGRADDQVKIRGFRIELGEIEAALAALPGVREAAVVAREDRVDGSPAGSGNRRLVAYFAGDAAADALRRSLRERLPEYMVPAAFVALDTLPLTPNGKVDREALPAPEGQGAHGSHVAPRTREEELLAAVWAQVLRVPGVGVNDNFFELGGDSILSVQIVARARQAGLHLTVRQIFEHQTVAELARHATAMEPGAAAAEQGAVAGEVPLTPIQRWFFAQDFADPHHFNQSLLLESREPLVPTALEGALAAVVAHHDALRLRFDVQARDGAAGGWRQESARAEPVTPFYRIDLAGLPPSRFRTACEQAAAALQTGFDLSAGPLTRLCLFEAPAGQPAWLLWVTHHLAVDGVSWRLLLEDLEGAYRQVLQGLRPTLPPKTTSFQEWARRLAAYAGSETLARELDYWRETARAAVPRLPVDFPSGGRTGAGLVADEASVSFELTAEETGDLLQTLPAVYHSRINDALLSALVRALAAWTGSPRLRVDLEGHGREPLFDDLDVSRTVGWFTSMYPVVLEAGDAGPEEALLSAKERLRAVPERGIGYGLLRYLRPAEDGGNGAADLLPDEMAEVSFNYLGQVDATSNALSLFGASSASPGPLRSPRAHRTHLLEVSGIVAAGRLRITLTYGSRTHRRETVRHLAETYAGTLRQLIQLGRESTDEVFTPSDFPKAGLDARSFDKLAALVAEAD